MLVGMSTQPDAEPPYLSAAQMREADRRCIEELGIPGAVLMEQAGAAVYRALPEGAVGVVCGKGNNGGDGYVVARRALVAGRNVTLLLIADPATITGDAATFLHAYQRLGGSILIAQTDEEVLAGLDQLANCEVLVDALLGTGIQGEVRGLLRTAIDHWPARHTVAVDLPSGMNADTGAPCGACVRADTTVTFQFPKRGFRAPGAAAWLGKLIVADIGIPPVCADDAAFAALRARHP
jgi:NAD(P)H-hydrate epimerase